MTNPEIMDELETKPTEPVAIKSGILGRTPEARRILQQTPYFTKLHF